MNAFDFSFTPSRGPARNECARRGGEAVQIIADGFYVAPSGKRVDVAAGVQDAVRRTVEHLPETPIPLPEAGTRATRIRVVNGTSLASARALAAEGKRPVVLNYASAKNPGGGFLGGARAQEESLARASALYACIRESAMYAHHRASPDCLYTDWMIWSPDVPVFRDDDDDRGALLEAPYTCGFLTSPAPNAKAVLDRDPARRPQVDEAMRARITRSLAVLASHGDRDLVLGAWGCGVFGNDPALVAAAYQEELTTRFAGVFDSVVFAILDWSEERRFVRPFAERFS